VVVRPRVTGLPVRLEWIDVVPVGLEQRLVGDLRRIIDHLHRLEMTRPTLDYLHVRGILGAAAHEADRDGRNAVQLKGMFHGPEAAAGEGGGVSGNRGQRQGENQGKVHTVNLPGASSEPRNPARTLGLTASASHRAPRRSDV